MLPVVWGIAVGIAAVAAWVARVKWNDIVIAVTGKRLAVLGARRTGKTRLVTFLTTGQIPSDYVETSGIDLANKNRVHLRDLDLKINLKRFHDVSGGESAYGIWKEEVRRADLVLYLINVHKLLLEENLRVREEYVARTSKDLDHLSDWLRERTYRKPLFLLGTHCDLDPSHPTDPSKQGSYQDGMIKVGELKRLQELLTRRKGIRICWIFGSTLTVDSTRRLAAEWLKNATR